MGPHSDDFHGFEVIQNLVNQSVLDIDSSRVCAGQIAEQFFVGRGIVVGIFFEDFKQAFGLGFQPGVCNLLRLFELVW
jgi:hypothetical protein